MKIRYPIAIEPGDQTHAFGVVVPDLPGCFSAGDTLDEAMENAPQAIELWLETVIEDGGSIPQPRPLDEHRMSPEYAGWVWAVIEIDLERVAVKPVRLNISLPQGLVRRIDDYAKAHHLSRSGFLAKAAEEAMRE